MKLTEIFLSVLSHFDEEKKYPLVRQLVTPLFENS